MPKLGAFAGRGGEQAGTKQEPAAGARFTEGGLSKGLDPLWSWAQIKEGIPRKGSLYRQGAQLPLPKVGHCHWEPQTPKASREVRELRPEAVCASWEELPGSGAVNEPGFDSRCRESEQEKPGSAGHILGGFSPGGGHLGGGKSREGWWMHLSGRPACTRRGFPEWKT